MKIVYCIPALYNSGGMERVLTQKANYLADKAGFDVYIVTTSQKDRSTFYSLSPKVGTIDLDIDYEGMMSLPIHKRIISRIKAKKTHRQKLEKVLSEIKPDITISMFTHEMSFLPDIKDGSKKILELHFSKNFRKLDAKSNHQSKLLQLLNGVLDHSDRRAIKKYDRFVILSRRDAEDWGRTYNNLSVISNPTAFDVPETHLSENKRILAVGRLCPQKGFDMLIDAWNLIPDKIRKDWHIDIFGKGPDKDQLLEKIESYGFRNSISLLPPTSSIQAEYASHSIFCFPSRYEGFPLSLMEAMSFGCAPIAFDCPCGPSELIPNDSVGCLIEMGEINLFAEKLEYVMTHPEDRKTLGYNAASHIQNNFSETVIMKSWIKLFKDVFSSK